jgi:hypothetical protein
VTEPEEPELTDAEVMAALEPTARRLAAAFGLPDASGEVLAAITADEAAVELLRAAFESGKMEAASAIATRGIAEDQAPDWSDIDSLGERRAIAREDSACGRCSHATVCAVARAAPPELLIVVSRCLSFRPD